MNERQFTQLFHEWIKENPPQSSITIELKIEKTHRFNFKKVKEHQVEYLYNSSYADYMYYKIPDMPRPSDQKCYKNVKCPFRFQKQKPFDIFCIKHAEAYIVIWFYHL